MFKNVAAKFMVYAFDATTGLSKTGDAANITAYVSKDYGTVTVLGDTSATEMDSTNAKGYYLFDAAQGETNADCLMVSAKSSTSNIVVVGAPAVIYTRPTTGWLAPATAGRTLVVDASGLADANTVKVGPTGSGTAQTARDIGGAVPAAAAGASGGLLISGSNAGTTTLGALTVTGATTLAAVSGTTLTFSGAVAFQSTFAVTTSTSLAALSCTTLTASGAVAFQSTFGVTGTTSLAAVSTSGTVTFNAFTVTNAMTVSGTTTHTGAVSFGSTFGVTGTTTLAALNTSAVTMTGALTITDGVVVSRSTSGGDGFTITGNGTGRGMVLTGGTSGVGLLCTAAGNHGASFTTSSSGSHGIAAAGSGGGSGLSLTAGNTGAGFIIAGGGASGAGIAITTSSGDGLSILPTAGNAITATGNGTSKHGLIVTGGTAGTSDGLKAVAGTGGVPIRGDLTGNITGTLATVTTLTNAPVPYGAYSGSVTSGGSTTGFIDSALAYAAAQQPNGRNIIFTSGTLSGEMARISAYNQSTKAITLESALTSIPANGVTYLILAGS